MSLNAYDLKALPALGINISALGCVMLNVEPVDLSMLPDEWGYTTRDPARKYISGVQRGGQHITLLYGLLHNANTIREHVDEVLDGVTFEGLAVECLDVFDSPYPDEDYKCIVGRLHDKWGNEPGCLVDAHARLSMLPHIDTFPTYKPHVTLAYVKRQYTTDVINVLRWLLPLPLVPAGIDYGYPPKD